MCPLIVKGIRGCWCQTLSLVQVTRRPCHREASRREEAAPTRAGEAQETWALDTHDEADGEPGMALDHMAGHVAAMVALADHALIAGNLLAEGALAAEEEEEHGFSASPTGGSSRGERAHAGRRRQVDLLTALLVLLVVARRDQVVGRGRTAACDE